MPTQYELAKKYEFYETPQWAANSILKAEEVDYHVVDPCSGRLILGQTAENHGSKVQFFDIHKWTEDPKVNIKDWLTVERKDLDIPDGQNFTVFMNPPFTKAVQFVEQSFALGANKVLCFQRFNWLESKKRKPFWEKYPPNKVYLCGDRAVSWRGDIPDELRNSSTPTAHAWFVWEKENVDKSIILKHIWK